MLSADKVKSILGIQNEYLEIHVFSDLLFILLIVTRLIFAIVS